MQPEIQSDEQTVVTNDKYADFESNDLDNVKNETVPEGEKSTLEEKVAEESTEKEEGEENADGETKRKKRGGGYQKKIARLEAENARLRELASQPQKPALEEPKPENFQDWNEYQKELRAYDREVAKRETLEEFQARQREAESKIKVEERVKTFQQQQEEARKLYDDYDDVLADYEDVAVRQDIHQILLESSVGAEIAYYLAKNPELFEKLNNEKTSSITLGRELGKIEASLENKKQEKSAVKVSKAPPPIKPLKTASLTPAKSSEEADYEEYRRMRGYN